MTDCHKRHIVITGTSSGIGKATMEAALDRGWHVFAGDRTSDPDAQAVEVGDGVVTSVRVDITNEDQVAAAAEKVAGHVGEHGLDGLANVAGIGIPGPLEAMPLDDLRRSFEVDVIGQVSMTQAMLPLLRLASGRIVFIGSIADRISLPFFGALTASKSAIAAVNDTFRQELAPWGIDVVLVEPGFISTGADRATKTLIDRRIKTFSPEQAELYGEMFKQATDRGYKTQTSGSSPDGVADVIMHAMTTKHPKLHYLTGSKSHLVGGVAKIPQRVQDAMKRKAFGLPGQRSKSGDGPRAD